MSKRINYISWEDYFLSVSFLSGMRSKDPCSQVGACIVNKDKIIVSIGYNGMPRGCSDDDFPWAKQTDNILDTKYMYVCHAELNAVLNKNSANVSGCTIYVALFPCNECAKILIQSRIVEVVYYSDKHKDKVETIASKRMLSMAGVKYRQYCPVKLSFDIVFKSPYATLTNGHSEPFSQADLDKLTCVGLDRNINMKRSDYITWEEYFMALVFLAAQRSKDPDVQLGACIVNEENKIVGIGYNGMPRGCDDSDFPWQTSGEDPLNSKYIYICHAEMNAILNKNNSKISNCRMYVASFPCNECAKFIIQEDIKEIIYFSDQHSSTPQIQASKKMLDAVGVKYRSYEGMLISVTIDFREIDWNVNPDPVQ